MTDIQPNTKPASFPNFLVTLAVGIKAKAAFTIKGCGTFVMGGAQHLSREQSVTKHKTRSLTDWLVPAEFGMGAIQDWTP